MFLTKFVAFTFFTVFAKNCNCAPQNVGELSGQAGSSALGGTGNASGAGNVSGIGSNPLSGIFNLPQSILPGVTGNLNGSTGQNPLSGVASSLGSAIFSLPQSILSGFTGMLSGQNPSSGANLQNTLGSLSPSASGTGSNAQGPNPFTAMMSIPQTLMGQFISGLQMLPFIGSMFGARN